MKSLGTITVHGQEFPLNEENIRKLDWGSAQNVVMGLLHELHMWRAIAGDKEVKLSEDASTKILQETMARLTRLNAAAKRGLDVINVAIDEGDAPPEWIQTRDDLEREVS